MKRNFKKLSAFFVTLIAVLCVSTITAFAGSSFYDAQTIKAGTTYNCTISYGGQNQYYAFTPSVTADYTFYSTGSSDTYVTLYDSWQDQIAYNDDGGEGSNFSLTYTLTKGETYYFAVRYYSSSTTGSFNVYLQSHYVAPVSIAKASVKLSKTSYTYNGEAKKPSATVKLNGKTLVNGTDYTISYKNNKNKGTATATIKGKGAYTGSVNKTFKITAKKITSCKIYHGTYNEKAQTPAVYYNKKVYDAEYDYTYTKECKYKKGTDYTIKVSGGHKQVGEYKVTIKFKGNYSGTVKKTFKIYPKPVKSASTSMKSTSEIKVKWKKVKNVSGYKVYVWNSKKSKYVLYKTTNKTSITIKRPCADDIDVDFYIRTYKNVGKKTYLSQTYYYDYEYLKPSAPSFTIRKTDFGEFVVDFKTSARYQIQVSTNKSFKNTSNGYTKTFKYDYYVNSVRFYNWESGRKYYVRARRYFYDKKGNLKVGPWSKAKTVTPY